MSYSKSQTLSDQFQKTQTLSAELDKTENQYPVFNLNWSHYLFLMGLEDIQYLDLNKKHINDIPNAKDRNTVVYF